MGSCINENKIKESYTLYRCLCSYSYRAPLEGPFGPLELGYNLIISCVMPVKVRWFIPLYSAGVQPQVSMVYSLRQFKRQAALV